MPSSFDDMMARLDAGDAAAVQQVFHRYAGRLIGLARDHLGKVVRPKVDAEDVVQSAFKSFFLRHADGEFELENWESLWGLLVVITLRKCGREVRRFRGPCRDARKELPARASEDSADTGWEIIAREPTPLEAVTLAETVENLMRGLSEREREVLELRLQGNTVPQISNRIGRTEFTVEGILKKIRKRLRQLRDQEQSLP
jgi:RNA polymerase sigma-70 factor (ECF subfamily)